MRKKIETYTDLLQADEENLRLYALELLKERNQLLFDRSEQNIRNAVSNYLIIFAWAVLALLWFHILVR